MRFAEREMGSQNPLTLRHLDLRAHHLARWGLGRVAVETELDLEKRLDVSEDGVGRAAGGAEQNSGGSSS